MIYWMSERTQKVLDYYNVEVVGFDPEKSSKSATCLVTHDGVTATVYLGDVSRLDHRGIDIRFAAAMHRFAMEMDVDPMTDREQAKELYDIADTLLGSKELPHEAPKLKWYKFSMRLEAEHAILAGSLDEAENKAREWMDGIKAVKLGDGYVDSYVDVDEFVARTPTLMIISEA